MLLQQVSNSNIGTQICGLFCGLIVVIVVIVIVSIAGLAYFAYWLHKRAIRNAILEADKEKEKEKFR